jgi:hypothetical protein
VNPTAPVITVQAPSASPSHPSFSQLLDGISKILNADAPAVLNLVPSNGKLAVALAISEIGLSVASEIAQLLNTLHPAAPAAPVAQ